MANIIQRFIDIVVNSDDAVANLNKTEQSLNKVDDATTKVEHSTGKLNDSVNKNTKSILDNGGAVGLLNELTGGLASTFKDASEAIGVTGGSLKTLKGALAATGVGLLVIGLGLLIENFDKVREVAYKLVPGLKAVGDFIGGIIERVTDFIGVTSDATRAVDRMKAEADASIALNKKFLAEHESQLDEFTKQKIAAKNKYNEAIKEDGADQQALALELNRQLAAIEFSRGDEQRKIQAENAKKAEEQRKRDSETAKKEQEKRDKEELDRIRKAGENAQQLESQAFQDIQKTKRENELAGMTSQEADLARIKDDFSKRIELAKQFGLDTQALLDAQLNAENEIKLKHQKIQYDAEQKIKDDASKADKEIADTEAKTNADRRAQAIATLNQAAELLGEQTAAGKAAAIASTTISTYESATKAYAALSGIPIVGPALGAVAAGIAVAAGLANVKKILAVKTPKGGGGGSAPSAGGQPTAPGLGSAAAFNLIGQSPTNALAQTIGGRDSVIKAQVVSTEVATAMALDRNRIEQSIFL